jgi:hypothetical protein
MSHGGGRRERTRAAQGHGKTQHTCRQDVLLDTTALVMAATELKLGFSCEAPKRSVTPAQRVAGASRVPCACWGCVSARQGYHAHAGAACLRVRLRARVHARAPVCVRAAVSDRRR